MACVIETGSGAAHPQEKLEHLWVCVKSRSSGDLEILNSLEHILADSGEPIKKILPVK